jgi:hypothetical protein
MFGTPESRGAWLVSGLGIVNLCYSIMDTAGITGLVILILSCSRFVPGFLLPVCLQGRPCYLARSVPNSLGVNMEPYVHIPSLLERKNPRVSRQTRRSRSTKTMMCKGSCLPCSLDPLLSDAPPRAHQNGKTTQTRSAG